MMRYVLHSIRNDDKVMRIWSDGTRDVVYRGTVTGRISVTRIQDREGTSGRMVSGDPDFPLADDSLQPWFME